MGYGKWLYGQYNDRFEHVTYYACTTNEELFPEYWYQIAGHKQMTV